MAGPGMIRFGVQASFGAGNDPDAGEFLDLGTKLEDLGFDALYVADHPGLTPSPFVALAAVAAITSTLRLGTYVLNCGVRDPLAIASDAATLDQLSGGRVVLGLGAGHTPNEWTMAGHAYPSARARVARLAEMIDVVTRLLAGETVTHHGRHLDLDEAAVDAPRPVQTKIPLLIGGNGPTVLQLAGEHADIVGLTGLGRTLSDGHRHEVDWQPASIDERVGIARRAAAARPDADVGFDALVQHVEITDDRDEAAQRVAGIAPGLDAASVIAAPYALVGTIDQLADEVEMHRERWGITSYVVRAGALDLIAPLIERLRTPC